MSLKRFASNDNKDISPPPAKRKVTDTTTNKAVANFFKPASAKEKEPEGKVSFTTVDGTLLVARFEHAHSRPRQRPVKVAAFDFDGTLVRTKSGLRFARGEDDWTWWHASVPGRLRQLDAAGYAVVVMSNQGAVKLAPDAKSKAPKADMKSVLTFKGKVGAVLRQLDVPVSVYAATGRDVFRKPRGGMWERMLRDYGLDADGEGGAGGVDREACVFVGDAAGRAEDKAAKTKKDHSCSDRDFAANLGIGFQTPEEFFLQETAKPFTRPFDPAAYLDMELSSSIDANPVPFEKKHDLDLVLFCGSPGAGKSTFYWTHLKPLGYERVNQDILKTRDKCMRVATSFIEDEGVPVVVDNTNADIETRAAWIALARRLKVSVRLVHFTAPAALCEHNDIVRALTGEAMNPEGRTMLPKLAFTGFASRYRQPSIEEGFEDVTTIGFKFEGSEEQKALWTKYWTS